MAHGITLQLRKITRPEPQFIVEHGVEEVKLFKGGSMFTRGATVVGGREISKPGRWGRYTNRARDEKRHARLRPELRRHYFFSGHGQAWETSFGLRYECPCGRFIAAPSDDPEFMTDVMDHETEVAHR